MSREMYKEHILDHYQEPSNFGRLIERTHSHRQHNPSCGDDITIELNVKDGKVADVRFTGHGCAISIASASLLTEKIKGMGADEVLKMKGDDVLKLLEIPIGPVRMRCALLPLEALRNALGKEDA